MSDRLALAQKLVARGNSDDAFAEARAALAEAPTSNEVKVQSALVYLDGGDPQTAVGLLDEALAKDPRNPAFPVFLGLAHADLGNYVRAHECLMQALQAARDNRLAQCFLAVVAMREGKPAEALRITSRAGLESDGRFMGRMLVEVEKTLHRLGVAEWHVAAAGAAPVGAMPAAPPQPTSLRRLLIDPLLAQWGISRAERHLQKHEAEPAVAAAEEALQRYAEVPRGYCVLGVAYLHAHRTDDALAALLRAAEVDGRTPDVLYSLGCCYHERGELALARQTLTEMLASFEKDAAAYYTLGQIELEEGNELQARRRFEYAAFLDFLLIRERIDRLRAAL